MTTETRKLIDDLVRLFYKTDGIMATKYTETISSGGNVKTRSYMPFDTGLLAMEILQTEIEAEKAGKPAQHDKETIAQARELLRLAKWHRQTAKEQAEEWST